MSARRAALVVALFLASTVGQTSTFADPPKAEPKADAKSKVDADAGQADLDEAVAAKLTADSPQELGEVIALCEQALEKGLDEANTEFAEKLLASTLFQRGRMMADAIFAPPQPDPRWPQLRQLALHDLTRSVKVADDQPQAYMIIGRLESLPGGSPKQAIKALENAIRTAGEDVELKFDALMLHAGLDDNQQDRLKDLDQAVKLKPTDPLPLRLRGSVKLAMGNRDAAIADFDAAIKLDPKNAATYEVRGMALAMEKRLDEARDSYAHAVELAPKSPALLLQRAEVNYLTEKFADAVADATEALKLDSDNLGALLLRAQSLARLEKVDQALADVDRILKEQPSAPPALRIRAVLLAGKGKTDDAIRDLSRVYEQDPRDVEIAFQLAMLYRTKKNFAKAMELINEAASTERNNWFVLYGRGDLQLGMGKHAEALADYEAAYKLHPDDSGLLNNFAWLLATTPEAKLRNGKRAVELATKACELTKYKAAHILSTLAAGYAESGDFETAKKWSKKAIETSEGETREQLEKELASYEAGKPVRELLHEDTAVSQLPTDEANPAKSDKEAAKSGTLR